MKRHHILTCITNAARRAASLWLCLAVLFGVSLTLTQTAEAASWMDPYLNQMKEWGVMKGDANGELHGERAITRAEFVAMLNRAFAYQEMGANPFTDVPDNAWYADDIRIAYKTGYFQGTSATTASPNALVTREQAVALVGRSLRLKNTPGSTQDYQDGKRISTWSRGIVRQATDMGIINGYADGTFRPQEPITRGQAASVLSRAIGTLVNRSGEQDVGNVYGNLTITAPGVTLNNTIVTGNLYLTGGIGLDDVVLNNVTVGGKIVVCGTGASQKGESSVILRNVTANGLEIDSMTNQYLSVRAEGLTSIKDTVARTSSYIEDLTADGKGLSLIKLDGADGAQFQLAGNIKEVINRSPASFLGIGGGVANKVTVDERATGSTLDIGANGIVRDLNLDTAATVTGKGDITNATVNATGSTIPMLPDTIVVRPGVTGNIGGTVMDSAAAIESSEDPRLLAGYPAARNVAPTSADAVFSANKSGTIYWAVTALTDGSVNETVLLNPATSHSVVKSGNIKVAASKTELTAKLSGLTKDGSYYISAMLVDARGRHSPVKVTAFTTPDDTVPAFATGYPYTNMTFSKTDTTGKEQIVQAMVMPTKDCRLYYALLPKGSVAPTAANFKTGSITGNLGYGVVDVKKNTPLLIPRVNTAYLKEETTYDLYLWLNDADNGKSSAVKKLTVTTLDTTPPVLQSIRVSDVAARSVSVTFSVNEPATLYWAVVKHGADFFANGITDKETLAAKIQIETGVGALKKGSANASKAATDVKFTVSGLEGQTRYDLYYVVKDKAGNYNVYTEEFEFPLVLNTLDSESPTVKQEFTHDGTDSGKLPTPYPDTSIRLVFSESVKGKTQDGAGKPIYNDFKVIYDKMLQATGTEKDNLRKELANALRSHIKLFSKSATGQITQVPEHTAANAANWVIDYLYATVTLDADSGEMIVTFPYNKDKPGESAINLSSGVTYYFEISGIVDTSVAENAMVGSRGVTKLPEFTTIDVQLQFMRGTSTGTTDGGTNLVFDMNFRIEPTTAASVGDDVMWDLLFWSEKKMTIQLYERKEGTQAWTQIKTNNSDSISFSPTPAMKTLGQSLSRELLTDGDNEAKRNPNFKPLNGFKENREYGIIITSLDGSTDRNVWSGTISLRITAVASDRGSLSKLANLPSLTPESYQAHQNSPDSVKEVGKPTDYTVSCSFRDQTAPTFIDGYPLFEVGDSSAKMNIQLSRGNTTFYYVVTKLGNIPTTLYQENDPNGLDIKTENNWLKLPADGKDFDKDIGPIKPEGGNVTRPSAGSITNGDKSYPGDKYIVGFKSYSGSLVEVDLDGLSAETEYIAYIVLQGESPESTSGVYAFRFKTEKVVRPILSVSGSGAVATITSVGKPPKQADVNYMMIVSTGVGSPLSDMMGTFWNDTAAKDYNLSAMDIEKYRKMTFIQAMGTPFTGGTNATLGSVFDIFALSERQEQVAAWFKQSSADKNTIVLVGNTSLTPGNWTKNVDCIKSMDPKNQNIEYWFVAMGESPLGSGHAFSAVHPLKYPSNTPPQVIALSTTVDTKKSPLTNNYTDALNRQYKGTVQINFSSYLYYLDPYTKKILQVVDKPIIPLLPEGYVSSQALITSDNATSKFLDKDRKDNPLRDSLILSFKNLSSNGTITFTGLAKKDGVAAASALTLKMVLEKDAQGYYIPKFYITDVVWDATGGKLTYNPKK